MGQSLDNKIVVFDSRNKFSMVKKRSFKGHVVAGYACQIGFSPNGQFIMSGDGRGQLWFWDFKSGKILRVKVPQKVLRVSVPCGTQSKVVQSPLADGMEEYACGNSSCPTRFIMYIL